MKKIFKSKKIYTIAIILSAVALTLFFTGCTSPTIDVVIADVDTNLGDTAYEYLRALSGEELQNRTLGTQGELDSAKYIAGIMSQLGYEGVYSSDEGQGLQEFKTSFKRFSGEEINDALAHNVVFSKKSGIEKSKGEIILSCSYDNFYSEKSDISGTLWSADGSYESGASVAVLLTLAQALKDKSCDYDLTFAFFSGGCYGWKGAKNYVDNLDRAHLDKIALVLNFAMLGGGDNWYIYSGESKSDYGTYLSKCGEGYITQVPDDRNIGQFILSEDAVFNYANIGMISNQYYFDVKAVPTANVLSLNWEINDNPLFSEMKGYDNVYHTKNDTLQNMIQRKGEEGIKAQLFEIVRVTLTALDSANKDTLGASLSVAREQLPDAKSQSGKSATLANIIVKVILIAGLIAISYVIRTNLTKNFDKYIQAKKAKENGGESALKEREPFEHFDDVAGSQKSQESQEKTENKREDDPFM